MVELNRTVWLCSANKRLNVLKFVVRMTNPALFLVSGCSVSTTEKQMLLFGDLTVRDFLCGGSLALAGTCPPAVAKVEFMALIKTVRFSVRAHFVVNCFLLIQATQNDT